MSLEDGAKYRCKNGHSSKENLTDTLLLADYVELLQEIHKWKVPSKRDVLCQHQRGWFSVCWQLCVDTPIAFV